MQQRLKTAPISAQAASDATTNLAVVVGGGFS